MEKQDYINILEERLCDKVDDFFGDKNNVIVSQVNHIDLNPADWVQFTVDNFDLADQNYEEPKPHYTEENNWLSIVNNKLGRNRHNSFELNYGKQDDTNQKLIALLGEENIDKLGIERDYILLRLLVNMPGNGVPWHEDAAESYLRRFPQVRSLNECTRLWFPVIDWCNGHAFQIGNSVLTHWSAGDVWNIPWGVPHASSNFGYNIKYTVSLTGKLRE
ncbi:hypothetical protein OAV13_00645 [bacterium]|nr:hypothetical protein [bacterium]